MTVGLEERPAAVAPPWNLLLETSGKTPKTPPAGTTVVSLFDQIGTGRTLLILGEPGSGKTIALLQLARDLIARAGQASEHLIPVVLNLSSWASTRRKGQAAQKLPLNVWLVEELSSKYQVPRQVGETWIKRQQLLLLLDGLDEVQAAHRNACVDAINAFQLENAAEMVVCCRRKDYEVLNSRLSSQTAIYLQALTLQQSQSYLNQLTADLTGLKRLLATDAALQELAQSPLLLNIMVLAYQGVAIADLPETLGIEEKQQQLFNTYIRRMLTHRGQALPYSPSLALGWLIWLAQQMIRESQTVFLIETMQPLWLQGRAKRFYRLGTLLFGGLFVGLFVGLFGGLVGRLFGGLVVGLVVGLFGGLFGGLVEKKIEPVEKLTWSWKEARGNLFGGLFFGLFFGLVVGLVGGLFGGLFGLVGGLVGGLADGLSITKIEVTTKPNQGMWNSAKNFALVGLLFGLVGLVVGLLFWLVVGLDYGGTVCIRHFTLRLILCRHGHMPWNYARFLDKAVEHLFLQRVGGGYIFIHRLLLEHFAAMTDQQVRELSVE